MNRSNLPPICYFLAWVLFAPGLALVQAVELPLGIDPQTIIDENPAGTSYELAAGVHRGYELVLKDGDTLVGEPGAILSGAELLTGWVFEDPYWVHEGPHSKVVPDQDEDARIWEWRAAFPHDLFVDGRPLRQRFSRLSLYDDTVWYYDYTNDKVYIKFDPSSAKLELSGLCRFGIRTAGTGITLRDLRFENYATVGQEVANRREI